MDTDLVDFIMKAESGEIDLREMLEGVFLHAETLMLLQGSWVRTVIAVTSMIENNGDEWVWTAPDSFTGVAFSRDEAISDLIDYLEMDA
jgi:hypothetical protein